MKTLPVIDFAPTLVLYHANCPDGFGAAWAIHQRFGATPVYRASVYGEPPTDEQVRGQDVVMVDVSFAREEVERIHRLARRFVLIDHHASAMKALGDLPYAYFDLDRSGAGLAWDACFPGQPRPVLLDLVEDRDLWRQRLPQVRLLGALDSLPWDFEAWSAFSEKLASPEGMAELELEASAIDRAFQNMMDHVIVHARQVQLDGLRGWVVNAPHDMASFICARLYARLDTDFAMSWYQTSEGLASCSWRAAQGSGVDLIPIVQPFGGGGHPQAAGCRMSMSQLENLLAQAP